jgi:polysaccharide deacetylase 2 family uncharacterized protein YibQ
VLWAIVGDDPFGGEPTVTAPVDLRAAAAVKKPDPPAAPENAANPQAPHRYDGPAPASAPPEKNTPANSPANTKTITIIDGKTGARQEVVIPDPAGAPAPTPAAPPEQKFAEMTSHGPVPKIAADGTRPADVFARPVKAFAGKPGAPRVALIVAGLGVSASATSAAIAQLPGPVTFAFMPYGAEVERLAASAERGTRDSAAGSNGAVQLSRQRSGAADAAHVAHAGAEPGAAVLADEPDARLCRTGGGHGRPLHRFRTGLCSDLARNGEAGLIFVDDGANPRSVAARVAGANNLPFAKADIVLDAVPTPDEIDRALGRLEMTARERSVAVGIASALPVSLEHIGKWAKAAESRGLLLVPITAVVMKEKQS